MQLSHSTIGIYPIKTSTLDWSLLDRNDRHIFFLSTGTNSYEDIAYLLKQNSEFVLNRLCLLQIRGAIYLKENDKNFYDVQHIQYTILLLEHFKSLCVKTFYDLLQQQIPRIQNYLSIVTENYLESEFFAMLKLLSRICLSPNEKVYMLFQSIVEGYRLKKMSNKEIEIIISSLIKSFSSCLLDAFTKEIEKTWLHFCFILKHAIFALCQQK